MWGDGTTVKAILSQPASVAIIAEELRSEKISSRTQLARLLCRRFGLFDVRGDLRVSSCLKALRDLEGVWGFELPPKVLDVVSRWRPRRLPGPVPAPIKVPEQVAEIGDLRVVLVSSKDKELMRIWNELIAREHPQGERRLVGRQLRYLVSSSHGWLGAVGWSASALRLEARDKWIGWDTRQRHAYQDRVVNLSRFLIRPGVRCGNLASLVLGACVRRVGEDFRERYGYRPWLLESFVDRDRHQGTCFQAANWERIGQTKGRGRNDRECRSPQSIKDIYVYPLFADFRQRMEISAAGGSYLRPLPIEQGLGSGEWAEQEFGSVELGDLRLTDRLKKIVEDRAKQPNTSYLEACKGDRSAVKGYYYFIDSPRDTLNPEAMLATHRRRTIERMMAHEMVLVVQDTTDLSFSTRHHTEGLGLIGANQTGAESQGLKLHTCLALTSEGLPLGVLRSQAYAAEKKGAVGKDSIGRPIEEKKSFRWLEGYRDCVAIAKKMPQSRLVPVMDREADIFELFEDAEPTRKRVGVLVRARHDRRLEGRERKLFEELRSSANAVDVEVTIPRQRWKEAKRGQPERQGLPARKAVLTLRFEQVTITSTRSDLRSTAPIVLWGVCAREENPPSDAERIEWMLLTTEPIRTPEEAARIVELYCRRWRIEEWHRVLKTGWKVQEHQHETAERLKRAIVIDAVLAWRIQLMTLLGREVPDLPCEVFFDDWEVQVLTAIQKKNVRGKEESPPRLGHAITLVAKLGGYLARRSDPPPGSECIWKGLIHLCAMTEGYRLASARAGP
jgi:hypothetical protein